MIVLESTEIIPGCYRFRVYDNDGATLDRYTVVVDDGDARAGMVTMLGMSEGGRAFSQWTEGQEGPHLGRRVSFTDLSEDTRNHIASRIKRA